MEIQSNEWNAARRPVGALGNPLDVARHDDHQRRLSRMEPGFRHPELRPSGFDLRIGRTFRGRIEIFLRAIAANTARVPMTEPTVSSASSARRSLGRNDQDHEE